MEGSTLSILIVTGSRDWESDAQELALRKALNGHVDSRVGEAIILIHGDARGADSQADLWANANGVQRIRVPANWMGPSGKRAGPERNQFMVDLARIIEPPTPDIVVVAFSDDIVNSRGTKDMVRRCLTAGYPVRLFTSTHEAPTADIPRLVGLYTIGEDS